MATLRQEAQDVLTEARDGIAWIAIWKDGRGWCCMTFWPDVKDDAPTLGFDDDETQQLINIAKLDPQAVIVNSYYHNLGSTEEMTRDTLANAIHWQYGLGGNLVTNVVNVERSRS